MIFQQLPNLFQLRKKLILGRWIEGLDDLASEPQETLVIRQ